MTARISYPPGVPCWIDTLQANPRAALEFYSGLFKWETAGPGPMPDDGGEYFVARVGGQDVAGIATLPIGNTAPRAWTTYIRVDDAADAAGRAQRAGGTIVVEPFDALPAGRAAILACPSGAVFGVWEPRQREGAQLVNASNAWAMSTLMTNDVDRAVAFYGVLFGWKPETFDAGAVPVTTCRLRGYVGGKESQPVPRDVVACIMSSGEHSPAAWNVDFWIDDVDAAAARAGLLGGRVVVSPYDTAIFRQAVLADREGATFSVSQPLASGVKRQKGGPHASRAASGAA